MILSRSHAAALAVALLVNLGVGCETALAAGQRSFVSTSGNDNPVCTVGAPCRSFAAAMLATSASGEIIVLDSGGYGPVTIAQSVSIIASPGVYAGISVISGHGVTIATALGDTVVLRGLTINNQGSNGRGIFITGAGFVRIDNVRVTGFTLSSGLNATPSDVLQLDIRDSVFRANNYGIALNHQNAAATAQISGTMAGVEISNSNVDGLAAGNNVTMSLTRSIIAKNAGRGVGSSPIAGQSSHVSIDGCEIAENNQAVYPGDTPGTSVFEVSRSHIVANVTGLAAGANSTIRVSDSVIEGNAYGVNLGPGGTVESAGNNVLRGNANFEPVLTTFSLR